MSSLFKSQCRLVEFSTEQNLVILSSNQNLKKKNFSQFNCGNIAEGRRTLEVNGCSHVWFSSEAHLSSPPAASSLRLVLDFLCEIPFVIELTWFKVVLSGRDPAAAAPPLLLLTCPFFFFLLLPPLMIATRAAICLLQAVQRQQDRQTESASNWSYKALLDQVVTILFIPYKRIQIPARAQCVQMAVKVAEPPRGFNRSPVDGHQRLLPSSSCSDYIDDINLLMSW